MLAADFIVDEPSRDVRLITTDAGLVQVFDVSDDPVSSVPLRSVSRDEIDSRVVQINAASVIVDTFVRLDGNALQINADRFEMMIGSDKTAGIETDDVNRSNSPSGSADIEVSAREITIGPGTELITGTSQGGRQPGDIRLIATDRSSPVALAFQEVFVPVMTQNRSTSIDINGAQLIGGDIVIQATGMTETVYGDNGVFAEQIGGQFLSRLEAIPEIGLSAISPFSGQTKNTQAVATIDIQNANLTATDLLQISSDASAEASIDSIALGGLNGAGFPVLVTLAYANSQSTATVDLRGETNIAASQVDITTMVNNEATVVSRADANGRGSGDDVAGAINLSLTLSDATSTIDVGENVTIASRGSVRIDARGKVENAVKSVTTVFQDGTGGLSVAVGLDDATVTSTVAGTITSEASPSAAPLSFMSSDIDPDAETITIDTVPANFPLRVGQRVGYDSAAANLGLSPSENYVIASVTPPTSTDPNSPFVTQTITLRRQPTIDLSADQVPENSVHRLQRVVPVTISPAQFVGESQIAAGTLPVDLSELVYLGPSFETNPDATGVPGLIQNQRYRVIRDGDRLRLFNDDLDELAVFENTSASVQGFYYVETVATFTPRTDVDNDADVIRLPAGHGLSSGDLVFYETDPTRTINRQAVSVGDGSAADALGDFELPDAPIEGLRDGFGYRVVIDPVSPDAIRLTTSVDAAENAAIVDLSQASGLSHQLTTESASVGIVINAELEATNTAEAGASLSDSEQPWVEVAGGLLGGRVASSGFQLTSLLREKFAGAVEQVTDVSGSGTDQDFRTNVDLAGSFAMTHFDHQVRAIVRPTATLTSFSDLHVTADVIQNVALASESIATRRGLDDDEAGTLPEGQTGDRVHVRDCSLHAAWVRGAVRRRVDWPGRFVSARTRRSSSHSAAARICRIASAPAGLFQNISVPLMR